MSYDRPELIARIAELEKQVATANRHTDTLLALIKGKTDTTTPIKLGEPLPYVVSLVFRLLGHVLDSAPDAENYLELTWAQNERTYNMLLRYKDGETPAQKYTKLKTKHDDIKESIQNTMNFILDRNLDSDPNIEYMYNMLYQALTN